MKILSTPVYSIGVFIFCHSMTHFFLHGGRAWATSPKNSQFFQTLISHGTRILIFPFGLEKEEEWYAEYRQHFLENSLDAKLVIECAHRDPDKLIQQIQNSDVLFFSGGKPYKHFEVINTIENFKTYIQDKVVAWTSGGAIMRSYAYYSSNAENFREGNHFLPIKIIAHRWSETHTWLPWEQRKKLLDDYGQKLPIYTLAEQEYVEFVS